MSMHRRQACYLMSPCLSYPCILAPETSNSSKFKRPQALVKDHQHFCHFFQLINQINIDQEHIYLSQQLSSKQHWNYARDPFNCLIQICVVVVVIFSFYFHQLLAQ